MKIISPSRRDVAVRLAARSSRVLACGLAIAAGFGGWSTPAPAADIIKADNADALNVTTSWSGGVVPTAADVGVWDNTVTGANSVALGGNLSWQGIRIADPGGAVAITTGNTLTLGTAGIDMSAATQDLSINPNIAIGANQTWTVAGGRTLRGIAGAGTSSGSGSGNITMSQAGSGLATIVFNQNGNTASGQTGWSNYSGTITVNPNVKAQSQGNAAAAFGTGTLALAGGQVAQANGNWTWGTTIDVTADSVIGNDSSNGLGRTLKLLGPLTSSNGSGLTFTNNVTGGTRTADVGFLLAGASVSTYGATTISADSRVRVGGNATASSAGGGINAGTQGSLGTGAVNLAATSAELAFTRTDAHTVANDISGTGTLYIGGTTAALAGTSTQAVTLTGTNTYSGATTIAAGTLQVGDGGTAGTLGSGTVTNNGSLVFNRSDDLTAGNAISGTGSLTKSGAGSLFLTAGNSYTGVTTVSAGSLVLGDGGTSGSLNDGSDIVIDSGATFHWNRSNSDLGFGNAISGEGTFLKSGGGEIGLTGTTTFSGLFDIQAGKIGLPSATSVDGAPSVNLAASGTLSLGTGFSGGTATIGNLSGSGTVDTAFGGSNDTRTLSVNQTSDTTFSGTLADAGTRLLALTKTGSGTLTLSGISSLSGTVAVNAGTLLLTNNNTFSGPVTVAAGSTLGIGNGSTGGFIGNGANITNAGALVWNRTNDTTVSNDISGSGSVTKQGTGTLTLEGASTYTGPTVVDNGTLTVTGSLSSSTAVTLGGATFSYGGAAAQTLGGLTVSAGANTITNTNAGDTNTLGLGAITSTGGIVNFSNATDTDNVVTTTTANTNGILGPWATVGTNWATVDGSNRIVAYTAYTDVTRLSSGTKAIPDDSANNVRIVEGTGAAANITLASATTATNTLLQSATGGATTVDLSTNTLRTGGMSVASGASGLTIGTAANSGSLTAASPGGDLIVRNDSGSGLTVNATIADNTSPSSLTVVGNSTSNVTLTLTGTNTYTGGTTLLNTGVIRVGNNAALGTGDVTFANSGVIRFGSDSSTARSLANPITFSGEGDARFGGSPTGTGTLTFAGPVSLSGGNRTFDVTLTTTFSGNISDGGPTPGSITKIGASSLVLSGTGSTFSGGLNIRSGDVRVNNAGALGGQPDVNITGGRLVLPEPIAGQTLAIGNLTGTGGTITSHFDGGTGRTLQINQTVDGSFAGLIEGSSGNPARILTIIKTGTAALTLSGSNTYAGATTVSAGTLLVNGSLANTSGVSVASAATLGGSGSIGGPTTILDGGILSPGTSPGTLTITDTLSLAGTSILDFEIDATDPSSSVFNDLITGVTDLTLGGTLNLTGTGDFSTVTQGTSWRLIDYTGGLTDNTLAIGTAPTLSAGLSFSVDTATTGQVNLVVVPEPGMLGLAGCGLVAAALAAYHQARRRKAA